MRCAFHGWVSFLYLFRWNSEEFVNITGHWNGADSLGGRVGFQDIDGDGVMEVLIPHVTRAAMTTYGKEPSVYRWTEAEFSYGPVRRTVPGEGRRGPLVRGERRPCGVQVGLSL